MNYRQEQAECGVQASRRRPGSSFVAGMAVLFGSLPFLANGQPAGGPFYAPDLAAFYTSTFSEAAPESPALPHGAQTLGGVPFNLGGRIELTGIDAARHGEFLPPQVTGIPVHRKALWLHWLHGARHGQKDGIPLANVVLHFKNGERRIFRLAFGVHARNSIEEGGEIFSDLADPNSRVVWQSEPRGTNELMVRLFKTVFENPLPDQEISTIDFVSLFSRATPILFGVTLQNRGDSMVLTAPPKRRVVQRASQFDDSVYRRNLTVRVTDTSSGKALTNATAVLTIKDDSRAFFFGQYPSDSSGQIIVAYPPQQAVSLSLRVSSPGFVAVTTLLSFNEPPKWPDLVEAPLKRGSPIGGLVVDTNGNPVFDAAVIPFEISQTGSNQYTRRDLDVVKTGPDGKWVANTLSESLPKLSFEVTHPEYHSATYEPFPPAELLNRKVKMVLQPHIRIAGRVVNEDNAPIPRATVILDYGNDSRVNSSSDPKGRFSFTVPDPTNSSANVIVSATGYASAFRSVSLEATAPPMDIVMDAGSTFRMVMVDQNRRPVPGVKVSLDRWQGSRAISWRTQTDGQGRFTWDHAPAGQVMFRFEKSGYSTYLHSVSLPVSSEVTYTYGRQAKIAGRVIDAETRKPIDQFRAMIRYRYQNGSGSSSTSGRKGSFSMILGSSSYTELNLVIESRGYEPLSAELPVTGSSSNLFELKKAIPIVGVVLGPDGAPVAKAEVVLINPSTGAYMYDPGKFRRTSESYEVVITSADGRFELTPKLEADLVLAAHPKLGFVQASASELLRTGKIMLQPWGHVRGVLRVGDKTEPFHEIALQTLYVREPGEQRSSRPVYLYYYLKPEPDGRFAFDQVPPGNRVAYLRYQFQEKQSGTLKLSHSVPLSVKSGETNDIVIGGTGRTVLGKVEVTNANGVPVDWRRDSHTLRLRPTSSVTMPSVSFPPNATPQERQRIINQRNEAYRTALEDQARRLESVERLYVLLFDNDGSFQVPNVPPGDYTLSLHLTDPRQPNSYRTIGMLNRPITIPEGASPHKIETVQLRLNP